MKLSPKRGSHGFVTSYTLNVGSKEARDAGFLNPDGTSKPIQKTVDVKRGRIVFEVDDTAQEPKTD